MAGKFEPKEPVQLNPPKDDPITLEELSKCNGVDSDKIYVAIKGKVYDVTGNPSYLPGKAYHVFTGKDASRALGMTSTKPEDVVADWSTLSEKEKGVLQDWITFFSKRYNIVGVVAGTREQAVRDDALHGAEKESSKKSPLEKDIPAFHFVGQGGTSTGHIIGSRLNFRTLSRVGFLRSYKDDPGTGKPVYPGQPQIGLYMHGRASFNVARILGYDEQPWLSYHGGASKLQYPVLER
ncbi:progesterone binding protein, putative [Cordyceps militaris CM01]|uniref:Progesterone binding protein, putative n=1 Tax=Cordyceps militaris (strain CM01) TaxID=983644 RepID=G3JR43_CORMM|nr:progesterone binding protein, putative [Cordyceps militaris CM01]EGX88339.1 progesterone binding protein, putative [Cordyceps militaris CM01]